VIQLLAVHIEDVAVSLRLGDTRNDVQIKQTRHLHEAFHRLNECKLVEVASSNDVRLGILRQNLCNQACGQLSLCEPGQIVVSFPCGQLQSSEK
jgi:hypothetical protein